MLQYGVICVPVNYASLLTYRGRGVRGIHLPAWPGANRVHLTVHATPPTTPSTIYTINYLHYQLSTPSITYTINYLHHQLSTLSIIYTINYWNFNNHDIAITTQ